MQPMVAVAPFTGFPSETFAFLGELEEHNEREWFQAHKQDYLDHLVAPAQSFIVTFGTRLQALFPGIRHDTRMNGQGSMGRIYRDLRFTKDKTPYNTHLWFRFWEGRGKRDAPGFGVWFDTEEWGVHGGRHRFSKPQLEAYREAVVDEVLGAELETALDPLEKGGRYEIGERTYKRVPRGYDPDHPRARWLRYGGLGAHRAFRGTALLQEPEFVDRCVELCEELGPLHRWLVKVDARRRPGR